MTADLQMWLIGHKFSLIPFLIVPTDRTLNYKIFAYLILKFQALLSFPDVLQKIRAADITADLQNMAYRPQI